MSVVDLRNITYSICNRRHESIDILKKINLQVNQEELHIITGPSGSGKTTLLQIIGTILHPTNGNRLIFRENVQQNSPQKLLTEIRLQIGYLFQTPFLPMDLSVKEFIEVQASLTNVGVITAENRALDLLKKFNIEQFADKFPKQLSGGEKQRVALAAVLSKNIKLLLLDEPTGSLDYDNKTIIWDLISNLKSKDLSIIAVSHDETIADFSDFYYKLGYGKLIQKH